jgi:uncharacterized protein (TIGR02147 family)
MQSTPANSVSVFHYLDARKFLRDACRVEKIRNPAFSQRYIAKALKAASSSFFQDVLSGKSALTPARTLGFSRLFKLSKQETHYFENLVLYTQAESDEEKKHALEKLKAVNPSRNHAFVDALQMEYFADWRHAAIRELLAIQEFRGDDAALGRLLSPPLSAGEVRSSLELLLRLKMIHKTAHGGYERTDRVVVTRRGADPERVRPALIGNLELARRALDRFAPEKRPFSFLTLSVSENSFRQIHEKLRGLRQEIFDIVTKDDDVDRLYQLNFQFFPLSEPIKRRKK